MALNIGQTFKLGKGIRTGVAPGGSQFGVGAGQSVKIIGSRNVGGQQFFDIQHIGGGTGWTPASSLQAASSARPRVVATGPTSRQKAASRISAKEAAFRAEQAKESKTLETEFTQFRTGLEPLDELRQRLSGELGIPGLQEQLEPLRQRALRLEGFIEKLPEDVATLTRGQGEARRRLLETSKGSELARELAGVARSQELFAGQLTGARGELTERLGVTQAQRQFDLSAFGQQADLLNTRLAREITGYTSQLQREFESIIGDIERAEDLKDQDTQRAFELAKLEKEANLEAQNIRLRSGLSQSADKEGKPSTQQLQTFAKAFQQSVPHGKKTLLATVSGFLTQFPQFRSEIIELAENFGATLSK